MANCLIMSRIIYFIPIWGATYQTNLRKLQALINKTARWVTNSNLKTKTK